MTAPCVADQPYRLRIGDQVPDIEVTRHGGGQLRLSQLRRQALAVTFYSPYCEPCQRELPILARVVARVGHDTGSAVKMVVRSSKLEVEQRGRHEAAPGRYVLSDKTKPNTSAEKRLIGCDGDVEAVPALSVTVTSPVWVTLQMVTKIDSGLAIVGQKESFCSDDALLPESPRSTDAGLRFLATANFEVFVRCYRPEGDAGTAFQLRMGIEVPHHP